MKIAPKIIQHRQQISTVQAQNNGSIVKDKKRKEESIGCFQVVE